MTMDKPTTKEQTDESKWDRRLKALAEFAKVNGHCNVKMSDDPPLGRWVAAQRHFKKTGRLRRDRIEKLSSIGMVWAIYGSENEARQPSLNDKPAIRSAARTVVTQYIQTLTDEPIRTYQPGFYRTFGGMFVPHNGGDKPKEVKDYLATFGRMPSFLPLPMRRTTFLLGEGSHRIREIVEWEGKGSPPPALLEYVREHGALPDRAANHRSSGKGKKAK
jgi:hypothetical protein